MADASLPVLGGWGPSSNLILHPLVRPLVQNSRRACLVLLSPVSSFIAPCCPPPGSVAARPRCRHLRPPLLYRPQRSLVAFVLFVSGNLLIRNGTKANQTPPRIARPLFPSWSFAWISRPSFPTGIKQRLPQPQSLGLLLFPICDIARWEPLDTNSVSLGRSFILLSWNWRSDARSQLLVPPEKLPQLPLTHP